AVCTRVTTSGRSSSVSASMEVSCAIEARRMRATRPPRFPASSNARCRRFPIVVPVRPLAGLLNRGAAAGAHWLTPALAGDISSETRYECSVALQLLRRAGLHFARGQRAGPVPRVQGAHRHCAALDREVEPPGLV